LNEAFSDIFGEAIDLVNGAGDDSGAVKWLMGEEIPGFGAIRDMSDPTTFGDPDKISSPLYYCGFDDHGGVHSNSGVPNKLYYLLTEGGHFSGTPSGEVLSFLDCIQVLKAGLVVELLDPVCP
jgi:Zn-dependent metalloprotease